MHATCSQGEIDVFVSAAEQPRPDTGCGCVSRDPHQRSSLHQGQGPSGCTALRAAPYFAEPPFFNSCSCWQRGSPTGTRAGVGYHHPMHITFLHVLPEHRGTAALPWLQLAAGRGPTRSSAGHQPFSTSPPARAGSGQLRFLFFFLEGDVAPTGKKSFMESFFHMPSLSLPSPCPRATRGDCNLSPGPALRAPHAASPHTHLCSPSFRAGQLSPEGSSQDNFQTIQYKWSLQTYFFTVSSCPGAPFPSVHPAGAQQNGGCFLFLWKKERKTKNISVANSCNFSPTVLDVFLHPLPSFLLRCIMQKSQISF